MRKPFCCSLWVGLLLLLSRFAWSAEYPLWGELKEGPYKVGFTTRFEYDYSRTFKSKYDFNGKLQSVERARPIQIVIWYPAPSESNASTMKYEEYVYLLGQELSFEPLNEEGKRRTRERYLEQNQNQNQTPPEALVKLMAYQTAAIRDALPVKAEFPLVIYAPGASGSGISNSILCEYLASHGYIVAALPSLGAYSRNATIDLTGFYAYMQDIEFVIGIMRKFPNVDHNHLAIVGFSMGGSAATLVQMRNFDIDAVVYLDTGIIYDVVETWFRPAPHYNKGDLRAAQLYLTRSDARGINRNFLDAIPYANTYSVLVQDGFRHLDFISDGMFAGLIPGFNPDPKAANPKYLYETLCRYSLEFLNAYLKNDTEGLRFLANSPEQNGVQKDLITIEFQKAKNAPPREQDFANLIREGQFERARNIFLNVRKETPGFNIFRESTLNGLGYEFLFRGDPKTAVEIFKLNIDAYPNSANAYDSLSDAYEANGDTRMAIELTQKALELLPKDFSIDQQRREAIKRAAEERLRRLKGNGPS